MEDCGDAEVFNRIKEQPPVFKKPILVGKRPGAAKTYLVDNGSGNSSEGAGSYANAEVSECKQSLNTLEKEGGQGFKGKSSPVSALDTVDYLVPSWSGLCTKRSFNLEVVKNGTIIQNEDLSSKPFFIIGRLPNCNIVLEHPSVSRFHAVLQYKAKPDAAKNAEVGWYLYDLGSTHGTWLNKKQIPPKVYIRVRVGHVFKFGVSTRFFILQGPEEDQELESDLTVTELIEQKKEKESRIDSLENQSNFMKRNSTNANDASQVPCKEPDGIDWGMGEDAQEDENPMAENPFAVIEEHQDNLNLDDPKKTLRGWFEREGYDLQYQVEEKSYAHFVCRVELPIDSTSGARVIAEASVKGGKKKEAVVQCALEACRILDRYGVLRTSTHESKSSRKKRRNDEDYYSSDEDTFLDRTGAAERKRQTKLKGRSSDVVETNDSLVSKYREIEDEIGKLRHALTLSSDSSTNCTNHIETDDLDSFMSALQAADASPKKSAAAIKAKLQRLEKEQSKLKALIRLSRPTLTPLLEVLKSDGGSEPSPTNATKSRVSCKQADAVASSVANKPDQSDNTIKNTILSASNALPAEKEAAVVLQPAALSSTSKYSTALTSGHTSVDAKKMLPQGADSSKVQFEQHSVEDEKSGLVVRKRKKLTAKPGMKSDVAVEYNSSDSKYDMWVPPEDQTGDGKTSLNQKLGY